MELRELKGVKEYDPKAQIIRERIIDVLKKNFKRYGYKPIETSILEYYNIAASKYAGSEILEEIYRLKDRGNRELCLRYELTFKLAKFIGLNPNLRFPFKRYEIGKVFRDGPVKTGRLREFTQCDIDVIGIKSRVMEAELITLAFDIFKELNLDVFVKVNSINILFGIFDYLGIPENKFNDVALSIDKLEKIGKENVEKELKDKISEEQIRKIFEIFNKLEGKNNDEKINFLNSINNKKVIEGVNEIKEFFNFLKMFSDNNVIFVPSLARGLSYYTGLIWELYLKNLEIKSSVAAGGRWDNLISKFLETKKSYPAVGMSFGLDVIFEALIRNEKKVKQEIPEFFIIPIGNSEKIFKKVIEIAKKLRRSGKSCDIAYEKKLSKALDYANKQDIKFCLIIGDEEINEGKIRVRDMKESKESLIDEDNLLEELIS